jgi:hypothetical protein
LILEKDFLHLSIEGYLKQDLFFNNILLHPPLQGRVFAGGLLKMAIYFSKQYVCDEKRKLTVPHRWPKFRHRPKTDKASDGTLN